MNTAMLRIPHLRIHNANALSSPFTIGFPAMTAWLGAAHALQRKLNAQDMPVQFTGVGVVSHQFDLQTYRGPGDYEYSIIGTGNSLEPAPKKDKPKGNAERPSFIEEARCHLEVSLVIECQGIDDLDEEKLLNLISQILNANMKIAGGDILEFGDPAIHRDFTQLKTSLMPGYALIERRDLMADAMAQGQDAMDALLDYLAIHHQCKQQEHNGELKVSWSSHRKEPGWIVPIATGFHGISELGQAKNQRNPDTPHRFAESIVTLGEFKMPYKMTSPDELFWHYRHEADNNLYLCQQGTPEQPTESTDRFSKLFN
ncbi:MAG: type I-F CRISPR-associated protein Csy2 [Pseudomonadales bacterium]